MCLDDLSKIDDLNHDLIFFLDDLKCDEMWIRWSKIKLDVLDFLDDLIYDLTQFRWSKWWFRSSKFDLKLCGLK